MRGRRHYSGQPSLPSHPTWPACRHFLPSWRAATVRRNPAPDAGTQARAQTHTSGWQALLAASISAHPEMMEQEHCV